MKQGSIELLPNAVISGLKVESLATDPDNAVLVAGAKARIWFAEDAVALRYWDGVEVHQLAKGGTLDEYVRRDGTLDMSGELVLNSADQSAAGNKVAISKGHLDTELAKKEEVLTGAATTVAHADLTPNMAMITDAQGKVGESTITAAEIAYLAGLNDNIMDLLDTKEDNIGFTPVDVAGSNQMEANLSMNSHNVTGVLAGTQPDHAVNVAQMENYVAGMDFQADVWDMQVDDTLDVTGAVKGERYIITDKDALHASFGTITDLGNGDIVEHDGTEFVVAYDVDGKGPGALVWNRRESAGGNAAGQFERWNGVDWMRFGGLSGVTAGVALEKHGDVIDVMIGAAIKVDANDKLTTDFDEALYLVDSEGNAAAADDATAKLSVKLNGDSLQKSAQGLRIKAKGVQASHLNADVISDGLSGGDGSALAVKAADASITVDSDGVKVTESHLDGIYARQDGATFTGAVEVLDAAEAQEPVPFHQVNTMIDDQAGAKVRELETRFENSYFSYVADTPAMAFTVTHNIGTKEVQVVCYDENDAQFIPNTLVITDANTVDVTVSDAILCRIEVQGKKAKA